MAMFQIDWSSCPGPRFKGPYFTSSRRLLTDIIYIYNIDRLYYIDKILYVIFVDMIPNVYPLPLIFIFVSKNNVICICRYKYRAIYKKNIEQKRVSIPKTQVNHFKTILGLPHLDLFPSLKVTLSLGTPQTIEPIATHTSAHQEQNSSVDRTVTQSH